MYFNLEASRCLDAWFVFECLDVANIELVFYVINSVACFPKGGASSSFVSFVVHNSYSPKLKHNILDHTSRKQFDPLKYLRKAHNFNKKGAIRIPKTGYRQDASAVYRKGSEYLIVRIDKFGAEKIVTYGVNDD
jgi:hypothetical protein